MRLAGLRATCESRPEFGIFHCVNAGTTTWCGFARAIMTGAKARGLDPMATVEAIATAEYPTKARRPAYSKLATDKIKAVFGLELPAWQVALDNCLDTIFVAGKKP